MPIIKYVAFTTEKGIRDVNEDQILVNRDGLIFGVFDGASSLVPYTSPDNKTGGYIAASTAKRIFSDNSGELGAIVSLANAEINKLHADANIDLTKNVNRFGTTVAVVKIREANADLLQIGDSIIIVINKNGKVSIPLGYNDQDIATMRKWRILADQGETNIRKLVDEDVLKQREAANTTYGLLNGDEKLASQINKTTIPLEDVSHILLLTDGMYIPKANPDAAEDWNQYAEIYLRSGLEGLLKVVRDMEDGDPELIMYPRFKLHDDASGIAIDFE